MRLKELKKEKGITGVQLAKKLGVSERSIIRWEKEGLGNTSFKYVVKIAEMLDIEVEALISEK